MVRRTRGRAGGIFVAERKVERDLTSLAGLPAYLRRQGFQSDARVLSTATVEADAETAAALGLAAGALVLEVVRVRLADGEPISLERALFPAERFPGLLDRSLGGSLYELLETHYGLAPGEAEERIEVVAAGAAEARLLGLRRGAPLLAVARTAWDADGRAVRALARPVPRRPRADRRARALRARRADARGRSRAGAGTRLASAVDQVVELRTSLSDNFVREGSHEEKGSMATTKPDPGVEVRHEGTVESVLRGRLGRRSPEARTPIGLMGVIFVAVTGAAPISAMLFNVPFATGFGTGLYTPAAFLFATIILTIFSIGYVAMARKMRAAGGFYTLHLARPRARARAGGRHLRRARLRAVRGLAARRLRLLRRRRTSTTGSAGRSRGSRSRCSRRVLISVLCYFDVELSVKVLGFALIGEVDHPRDLRPAGVRQGGSEADGIQFESLNVFQLTDPGVGLAAGVGLFLAFWSWVGFEAVPNYAEESKDPKRSSSRRR